MSRFWVIAPYEANLPAFDIVWQFDLANGSYFNRLARIG